MSEEEEFCGGCYPDALIMFPDMPPGSDLWVAAPGNMSFQNGIAPIVVPNPAPVVEFGFTEFEVGICDPGVEPPAGGTGCLAKCVETEPCLVEADMSIVSMPAGDYLELAEVTEFTLVCDIQKVYDHYADPTNFTISGATHVILPGVVTIAQDGMAHDVIPDAASGTTFRNECGVFRSYYWVRRDANGVRRLGDIRVIVGCGCCDEYEVECGE